MNNQKLLGIAIEAAIEAGNKVLSVYDTNFKIELKKDESPLTIADKLSDKSIKTFLQKTPYPILSEEGESIPYNRRKNWNYCWIVDPLDGTKEFIKKNGEFTINIALIKKRKPIMGIIYVPVKKTLYFADIKIGAFKKKISENYTVSKISDILRSSVPIPIANKRKYLAIIASKSHMSDETKEFMVNIKKRHKDVRVLSAGSSLKLCLIAEGKADIYPRFAPTMEWDTAAGQAICEIAGFKVINAITKKPLIYNKEKLLNPWFLVNSI